MTTARLTDLKPRDIEFLGSSVTVRDKERYTFGLRQEKDGSVWADMERYVDNATWNTINGYLQQRLKKYQQ